MLGSDGWSMPVRTVDFRAGGKGRYEWKSPDGQHGMALSSEFVEVEHPSRIVHKEVFDGSSQPVESAVTSTFVEAAGRPTMTMVIRYPIA
ncbi:MAG: SRPBCC domain-containing protein [Proteobacteria bacterium]|nr:SRPBCC domain-containing protein [Pseudomonadota bacterium]